MRPQEKKEHCFLVCFNNVKKPLGAVRSRGSSGVCGSAGCLLGATRVVGTLGHARSVLGDVRPGARAQCGRGRGVRPARERLQLPHAQPGGGQKGQFLPVCVCAPLCGQGTVKPPRCVGQWPERVCSLRGGSSRTPGVLTPEGVARDGAWGTWSRGEMQKRSQNTAETSEPLPRMA